MNILVIDNSSISVKNGDFYTNSLNGMFIDELQYYNNNIIYFQLGSYSKNNINSYNLNDHNVKCIVIKNYNIKILKYIISYIKGSQIIKNIDFVYFYYPNPFKYLTYICRLFNKPYGIYIRGMNELNNKISYNIYKNATVIFTVSDYFTNMVNEITGEKKAHTIRPMIPYDDADIVTNRIYKKKQLYKILYLGRIAKDKGLLELIEATKVLKEKGYKLKLNIVGNGEFLTKLKQLIFSLNLNDTINLAGPVYDNKIKMQIYKDSDLYILPTYHEGFPRTLYEAMIFGTPIITTFVGGISALMIDGENCIKIEPRSVESIVDKISYAIKNYNNINTIAKNASLLVSKIVDHNRLSHAKALNQKINYK